jgi:hypothetical protein
MSSGRRITLLAVLIFIASSQAATACGLLCPLYWLFGCQHINPGYAGAYGNAWQNEPYASWKVIDDWLGYGYMRNQNGTLGHYPGNWYRNMHHGYGQAQPALAWQPQLQGNYPAPVAPVAPQPLYAPTWDPCCDPCGSMPPLAMMPQPQPQYYQQPQFYQPQPWMQAGPIMAGTVFGGECCDTCGSVSAEAPGCAAPVMQEAAPSSDCGCAGGSPGSYTQPAPPVTMMSPYGVPQQWNSGYAAPVAANTWHPGRVWSPQQHWQQTPTWTAAATARFQTPAVNNPWATAYAQYPHPQYVQHPQPQYAQYPQPQYAQPRMAQMPQPVPVMGDIYGDHEIPQNAGGFIRPNAFQGAVPIRSASLSGRGGSVLSRRYPASLR